MKTRWMKTVIDTSRQDMPALPFDRAVRHAARAEPTRVALKIA